MITLYPVFKKRNGEGIFFNTFKAMTGLEVLPFTCGRSAMVAGLSTAGLGRMDEILVPPYIGQCVLSALSRTSFPTMTPSIRTKAILVFHQFGFPQNLADIESEAQCNGWTILNDCANTLFTQVNGRFLIEWGDFSIISLSKLYLCGIGGGFYSNHSDIYGKVFIEHERLFGTHIDKAEQALEKLVIKLPVINHQLISHNNALLFHLLSPVPDNSLTQACFFCQGFIRISRIDGNG